MCQPAVKAARTIETCYVRNYYECDVDKYGSLSNCEYLYSEDLGGIGEDNTSLMADPEGTGGSTTYTQEEYILVNAEDWRVAFQIDGHWTVWSTEIFKGVKNASETNGGHFTGMSHGGDMLVGSPDFTWTRNSVATSYVPTSASSTISGKVRWSGVNPDETFVNSTTKSWEFNEVF